MKTQFHVSFFNTEEKDWDRLESYDTIEEAKSAVELDKVSFSEVFRYRIIKEEIVYEEK